MRDIIIPKQGDIIWINLNPTIGHEQQGKRPALVVSNDFVNSKCNGMVKVASITSTIRNHPLHVPIPSGLPVSGMIKLEQERAVDVVNRGYEYSCKLPKETLDRVTLILKNTY